jgi:hypothetical protein
LNPHVASINRWWRTPPSCQWGQAKDNVTRRRLGALAAAVEFEDEAGGTRRSMPVAVVIGVLEDPLPLAEPPIVGRDVDEPVAQKTGL